MKIVFTMAIPEELQQAQANKFDAHTYYYTDDIQNFKQLKDIDVIVTYGANLTETIIKQASALKWIMVFSAGVDGLPKEIIQKRNITVTNVRGIHALPMAEFVMAYLLDDVKQLHYFKAAQHDKRYESEHPVVELGQKTIIVAGTGAIGSQIATFAAAFGMQTIGLNTTGHPVDAFGETYPLEKAVEHIGRADYFVSVLPKTPETNGIYDQIFFDAFPKSAVFINIGRGNAIKKRNLGSCYQKQIRPSLLPRCVSRRTFTKRQSPLDA
ncbi:hypothetical protein MFLO_15416 [Listeria floridensis FSL S10-1187]|uniref:D-isomer specific 2-hydroxyacid dehydrogenase NAD-binding domain-containing protein n=1 Tax=Listeria floridensis FSL S10-1187 TaxID=1265817 RepID=A0ABP3ATS1_9LIST|nr:hypothetical protein MFLO_15416 [Listeria floridensis FSL S10-1187]